MGASKTIRGLFQSPAGDIAEHKQNHNHDKRVEELNCIYHISNLVSKQDTPFDDVAQSVVDLIPTACRNPEISGVKAILEDHEFQTYDFSETACRQTSDIIVHGKKAGTIEINYCTKETAAENVQFSKAKENFIRAIAGQLGIIVERRLVDDLLKQSEQEYEALCESIHDGLIIVDTEKMKVLFGNQRAMTTFDIKNRADLIGVNPLDLVHPEDRDVFLSTIVEDLPGENPQGPQELRTVTRDGKGTWMRVIRTKNRYRGRLTAFILFRRITEHKEVEEEIRTLHEEFDQRVAERTTQLQVVNKELEAFAYSVSHDLRAPLRSIEGFSQVLLEDYADWLDTQGRDYLHRVCSASQRMAQLIDDLLNFSRVTRVEMQKSTTDLSALAQSIATELQQRQPERQVEFVISPGLIAKGDSHLLQLALENVLGNAWKFTRKSPQAKIEFGCTETDGQTIFFVRDNGVGFDMAYADKLFSGFQRLHSPAEYEGTGIGLTTVKRIIDRHGGTIWADSVVGQGATFYFTLC